MLKDNEICLGLLTYGKRFDLPNGAIFEHNGNVLKVTSNMLWIKIELRYHVNTPVVKRFGSLRKFKEFLYR